MHNVTPSGYIFTVYVCNMGCIRVCYDVLKLKCCAALQCNKRI